MLAGTAADLVVAVHFAFILFVAFGGFLAFKWRRAAWAHIPCALWGVWIEWRGWICPLTPLEQHLRQAGGRAGYAGSFIEHYIVPLVYPAALTPRIQFVLGLAVLALNLGIYIRAFSARTARQPAHGHS
jgi:hypothetical protein